MSDVFRPDLFAGKNVVITGGAGSINLVIAKKFAQYGAKLGLIGRRKERLEAAAAELCRHGGSAVVASADVRDYEELAAAFKKIGGRTGPARHSGMRGGGKFSGCGRQDVGQRLQGGDRHRPARHVQLGAGGIRIPAQAGSGGDQYLRSTGQHTDGLPVACVRRESGRGHDYPHAGHRVGAARAFA